jgi:hypothetical protein
MAEAAALFSGQFTDGISDAEYLIVKQMGDIEVKGDRHEGGIEFVDKGVRDQEFTDVVGDGEEVHTIRDVK